MVSIGILLVLGVIIIGFLRGALSISRTGAARGEAYATSQTVMRTIANDLAQVLPGPAHPDGSLDDSAFLVMHDPFGRQMLAFTRAWGEEQRSAAGYDAGRGSAEQGYTRDFSGRNVDAAMRASHGNIEVVYLMEPSANGVRLYRAERSPPTVASRIAACATSSLWPASPLHHCATAEIKPLSGSGGERSARYRRTPLALGSIR
jgi:hypothetical protein